MKKVFIMTALVVGMIAGSSFGAVDWGYCRPPSSKKPVAQAVTSERERIAAMELETARLQLETAKISAGRATSGKPITEKDLPRNLEDFQAEHVEFVRGQAKAEVIKYQHLMGRMYARGEGLPQNDEKAAQCFRVAYYNHGYDQSGDALRALIKSGRIKAKDAEEKRRLGII